MDAAHEDTPRDPSILIIGGTDTGKSHFGAQLLRRLQKRQGELRMVGTPPDLSAFQEVIEQLAMGRSASHTPSNVYRESKWQVRSEVTGQQSSLVWPDYAGEQVEDILKLRHVNEDWVLRLRASDGWLLFIRPSIVAAADDVLSRPRALELMADAPAAPDGEGTEKASKVSSARGPVTVADEAGLVELLQILLFVRQADGTRRGLPALVLALSCWDEVSSNAEEDNPVAFLRARLPLISQFVHSNWLPNTFSVIGISALGKPLSPERADDDFADEGPERNGWCVTGIDNKSADLTLPVALLMRHLGR